MATPVPGQPAPAGGDAAPEGRKKAAAEQKQQPAAGEPSGEKKLSNAELKKRAKEEKAARRAAAKASHPTTPAPAAAAASSAEGKGARPKPNKHDLPPAAAAARAASRLSPLSAAGGAKDGKPRVPECFSHLSMARRIAMTHADKDVNPAVLALGQHMSTLAISDSITRLEATLLAFKKVERDASYVP